jgi:hypothetical protein
MRAVRVLAVVAVLVMLATIAFGAISGDFAREGSSIWSLAWGKVTLIDLYVGVVLFATWVALREKRPVVVGGWWLALIILGNLAAAVYLVRASFDSSDVAELLTGSPSPPR